jgi:hypothetical protein
MVNIAPPTVDDKDLVHEYTEICHSVRADIDTIGLTASSDFPDVSFPKFIRKLG